MQEICQSLTPPCLAMNSETMNLNYEKSHHLALLVLDPINEQQVNVIRCTDAFFKCLTKMDQIFVRFICISVLVG